MKPASKLKPRLKIAIIGPGGSFNAGALYDRSWQIWGLNASYRNHSAETRWTHIFNLHRLAHLERDVPQYVDWDSAYSRRHPKTTFVVLDSWRGLLKKQVLLPRRELEAMPRGHYHASSFDWMVAYAIFLRASAIHVYGASFAVEGPGAEPISARACLEYWLGYAQGLGIDTVASRDCVGLFRQFHLVMSDSRYGYDDVRMIEERR